MNLSNNANELMSILTSHAIKPSHPRLRIFGFLRASRNHPTADSIYMSLHKEMPTLSKMTVYNTLNLLVDRGLARIVSIDKGEANFDADMSRHGHFLCKYCGKIFDIDLENNALESASLSGFFVEEADVFYKGICPGCQTAIGS